MVVTKGPIMKDVMATFESNATKPSGEKIKIIAKIGKPYDAGENWACPVSLEPLYEKLVDQCGEDSFQALSLSMRLIIYLLEDFQKKGGTLDYPLEGLNLRTGK
jgi:Domain of unknown function (DUF6968)